MKILKTRTGEGCCPAPPCPGWVEALLLIAVLPGILQAQSLGSADGVAFAKTLVAEYCAGCHNQAVATAGVVLENLDTGDVGSNTDVWEQVLRKLVSGEMPPAGMPHPEASDRAALSEWLTRELDLHAARRPAPGRMVTHRLNRTEYGNAIRDLLGLEIEIDAFLPADDLGYGFDNIGDLLSTSPLLLERYLALARFISQRVVGDAKTQTLVCEASLVEDEDACAERILSNLARQAYRRPVTDTDIRPLMGFYRAGRLGSDFDGGIEAALRALLVSPYFLFRIESGPEGSDANGVSQISDIDLASRLSFFLWSSIPDSELLQLAEQGILSSPEILESQIARMFRDPRSSALVSNFAGQWLHLRNMALVIPDPEVFPEFDESLRWDLQRETELFFEAVMRDNRPLTELLDADFTFLNARLARHYGIRGIYGSRFRRVPLEDPNRGGLLGQGSILTVTSYPNRTSVVRRGQWILENLLGAPPPPPPPAVPSLDVGVEEETISQRKSLEAHRANANCVTCHARMDALGFALENYDAIGRWRTEEAGTPIDSLGELPDGATVNGPSGLKKVLLQRESEFLRTFVEKLLTYALGRGLEYYDQPTVRSILRDTERENHTIESVVRAIVRSVPFQMRTTAAP